MFDYTVVVTLILVAATLWTLARSAGWSKLQSAFTVFWSLVAPIVFVFIILIRPEFVRVQEFLVAIAGLVPFICLFALAKSVQAKVKRYTSDAPR